ncbi:hypothetical protein HK099_000617 [Clydaea vesicula]|uniref:C2H2-type domain-containing protein n=1 Tax=Clydaea vesicula TaxID=447962 RepID=A0AAD5U8J5_9FUNG|nr:hypothetical protein HK099_000617 [Clydaea vesicula]
MNLVESITRKKNSLSFGFDIIQLTKDSRPLLPLPSPSSFYTDKYRFRDDSLYIEKKNISISNLLGHEKIFVEEPKSYNISSLEGEKLEENNFDSVFHQSSTSSIVIDNPPLSPNYTADNDDRELDEQFLNSNSIEEIVQTTTKKAVTKKKNTSIKKKREKIKKIDDDDEEYSDIKVFNLISTDTLQNIDQSEKDDNEVLIPSPNLIKTGKSTTLFQCAFEGCEKTFTRPYNLKSYHTDKRPYKCDKCTQSFVRKNDYQRVSQFL